MNSEAPKFSLIVPIYNVEKYLRQCVDSVLSQTYKNFELILVDDGSPDLCPSICDEYAKADRRIRVIHKDNGGLVNARISGAEAARGDYVICLDGDDFVEPTYLEIFANAVIEHSPNIICCGYNFAYDDGRKIGQPLDVEYGFYNRKKIEEYVFPFLIEDEKGRYFPPMLWAKAYKRELYASQQVKVPSAVNIGEDHACTKPCIYRSESMYVLEECLYNYRQNPVSMTKNHKAFSWEAPEIIGRHFEATIDMSERDFQAQVYRSVVHNLFNVAVSQFNRKEKYGVIKKDILKNIQAPYYRNATISCQYVGNWKGELAKFALKYKSIRLMWLFCKIKDK